MPKKIGEALIEKGLVTAAQLEVALRNQLILGGHLGTCLLELGYVEEDELGETLSEVLRVPYARPSVLLGLQPATLRCLPKRVTEEFQVLPLDVRDKTLHVAMVDPKDLGKLDALRFVSGHRIAPWIAPEVRIVEGLERYYNIPRRTRYIAIARSIDRAAAGASRGALRSPAPEIPAEADSAGRGEETGPSAFGTEFGYGRSWVEVAEELCGRETLDDAAEAPPASEPETRAESPGAISPLAAASERLCAADDKDAIATAVLDCACATMARSVLLAVRGEEATVWSATGFPPGVGERADVRFPIQAGTLFDLLLGNEYFLGPLPREPRYLRFYDALGAEPPAEVFFVPVHLSDRLVALLLGDGGPDGRIGGDTRDYLRLVRMLAMSLSMLILKKKIRASCEDGPFGPARGGREISHVGSRRERAGE